MKENILTSTDLTSKDECIEIIKNKNFTKKTEFKELIKEDVSCKKKPNVGDFVKYGKEVMYLRREIKSHTYINDDVELQFLDRRSNPFHDLEGVKETKIVNPDVFLCVTYDVFICDFTFASPRLYEGVRSLRIFMDKYYSAIPYTGAYLDPMPEHINKLYSSTENDLYKDRFDWGSPMWSKTDAEEDEAASQTKSVSELIQLLNETDDTKTI